MAYWKPPNWQDSGSIPGRESITYNYRLYRASESTLSRGTVDLTYSPYLNKAWYTCMMRP